MKGGKEVFKHEPVQNYPCHFKVIYGYEVVDEEGNDVRWKLVQPDKESE